MEVVEVRVVGSAEGLAVAGLEAAGLAGEETAEATAAVLEEPTVACTGTDSGTGYLGQSKVECTGLPP